MHTKTMCSEKDCDKKLNLLNFLTWISDHGHAESVQVHLSELYFRVLLTHFPAAFEEKPIRHAHDVTFVHCCHLTSALCSRKVKRKFCHPVGGNFCDNLDTLNKIGKLNNRNVEGKIYISQGRSDCNS